MPPSRIAKPLHERCRRNPRGAAADHRSRCATPCANCAAGLRGFYVFIACIALGVMAIAGVGSVAASLSDGLAREGRTLLGGDVAFSLIQREAKPDEIAFLRSRGQVSVAATLRAHGAHRRRPAGAGRTQGGRRRLSDARRAGARSRDAGGGSAGRTGRRVRRGGRFDLAGAARSQARRPRHCRQCDIPNSQRGRRRAGQAGRRRRSRPALPDQRSRRCARPACCSPAAWCAGSIG